MNDSKEAVPDLPSQDESAERDQRRQRRREEQAERTRQGILAGAARAISRLGFERTTMEHVAREAGYSVGALYNYFQGKQELVAALGVAMMADVLAAIQRPVPPSLDVRQRFELVALRMLEVVQGSQGWILSLIREAPGANDVAAVSTHRRLAKELLASQIRAAMTEGAIRPLDPEICAGFFLGAMQATMMDWLEEGGPPDLTDRAPQIVQLVFDGIGAGPRPAPADGEGT